MIIREERIIVQRQRDAEEHKEQAKHVHSRVGLIGRLLHGSSSPLKTNSPTHRLLSLQLIILDLRVEVSITRVALTTANENGVVMSRVNDEIAFVILQESAVAEERGPMTLIPSFNIKTHWNFSSVMHDSKNTSALCSIMQ